MFKDARVERIIIATSMNRSAIGIRRKNKPDPQANVSEKLIPIPARSHQPESVVVKRLLLPPHLTMLLISNSHNSSIKPEPISPHSKPKTLFFLKK